MSDFRVSGYRNVLKEHAGMQRRLKDIVARNLLESGVSRHAYAIVVSNGRCSGHGMSSLLKFEKAFLHSPSLQVLCEYVGVPEIADRMREICDTKYDKIVSFSFFPDFVIDLCCDLFEFYERERGNELMTVALFSNIFAPYSEVVAGVLRYQVNMISRLAEEVEVRELIETVLCGDDWDGRVLSIYNDLQEQISLMITEFRELVEDVCPLKCDTTQKRADFVEMNYSTFRKLWKGERSVGRYKVNIQQIQAKRAAGVFEKKALVLEKEEEQDLSDSLVKGSVALDLGGSDESFGLGEPLVEGGVVSDEEIVMRSGGVVSCRGVEAVLTPDAFKFLSLTPSEGVLRDAKRAMILARAYLNMLAQLVDDETREVVRGELASEVEETHLAMRLFSNEIPSGVVGIYDDQRRAWEGDVKRKGKKR